MNSILGNIFLEVQARLKQEVPELRFIDQDLGQLEFYDTKPAVSFPCALIDLDDTDYSDEGENSQIAERAVLIVRLGITTYSNSASIMPKPQIEKAIDYYNLEHKVNKYLHGWADGRFFNALMRRKAYKEKRDDNIRVRVIRYEFSFRDSTAMEVKTVVPRPGLEVED